MEVQVVDTVDVVASLFNVDVVDIFEKMNCKNPQKVSLKKFRCQFSFFFTSIWFFKLSACWLTSLISAIAAN